MRLSIIAAASALAPAALAAHPAPVGLPDQAAEGERKGPALVREPDGTFTIRRTLPAYSSRLDPVSGVTLRSAFSGSAAPTPLGRRRSPSEQAMDEDLERAFEEAADMARFGAPD